MHILDRSFVAGLAIVALGINAVALAQSIRFVRSDGPGNGDGTSWANAYDKVWKALDAAAVPGSGITDIWVALGTHTPNRSGANNRDDAFALVPGVTLYGGFVGNETKLDQRNPVTNLTILSGDLNGNDGAPGTFTGIAENSRHVITAINFASGALPAALDGFTIRGGNADFNPNDLLGGGGVFVQSATLAVRNCRFEGNSAGLNAPHIGGFGGAIYSFGGNLTLDDCLFFRNRADNGGAMGVRNNGPGDMATTVTDCQFIEQASNFGGGGAVWTGHGPFDPGVRSISFIRCVFEHNKAQYGGAMLEQNAGHFNMIDCDFIENEAFVFAGALWHAQTAGKDQFPARVRGCRFIGNVGDSRGGAILFTATDAIVVNGFFAGNRSNTSSGGAIQCGPQPGANFGTGDFQADNCVFTGNHAFAAGALSLIRNPQAHITNCSFAHNTGDALTGGIFNETGATTIDNCVLWNNSVAGAMNQQEQLSISEQSGPVAVNNCLIQGLDGSLGGEGNISSDPLLADPDGIDGILGTDDDDLHLTRKSPAIDRGNDAALPADVLDIDDDGDSLEPVPLDLDGQPRIAGLAVDFGAFEVPAPITPGDVTGDGAVNIDDLLAVINAWGACPPSCPADVFPTGGDGVVNIDDLLTVINNWG
jgi:hypothetical protein